MILQVRWWVALVVLWVLLTPMYPRAQGVDELADISAQINRLILQGNFTEALPLGQAMVEAAQRKYGLDHPQLATAIFSVAYILESLRRYADAEVLYKQSLVITEKSLGPDHPDVAHVLNAIAYLYASERRYAEAELLYKRSL